MFNLPFDILFEKNLQILKEQLITALNSSSRDFLKISEINIQGIYIVFDNEEVIYVGKTTRLGKFRLREMITDYRSHTLNKKLLIESLKARKIIVSNLNKSSKNSLIEGGNITLAEFKECQGEVNKKIKKLKFKFYEIDSLRLSNLEHFAISILQPFYND